MRALGSEREFSKLVSQGLVGAMMPGMGNLGAGEMRELYAYVNALSGAR